MSIVSQTLQGAVLAATSNILAQAITAYRKDTTFQLDWTPILHFVVYSLINTPPNILWQQFLESKFPSMRKVEDPAGNKKTDEKGAAPKMELDKGNTITKLSLDLTIGAALNTWAFVAYVKGVNGAPKEEVWRAVVQDSWPLWLDGLKVWPLVSLICFTVLPVERRLLFAGLVGVGWGIYLSMVAAEA